MDDQQDDVVLELKDLYVGYYKDLNILQALNIKAILCNKGNFF